ncbi:huntingtin [Tribolium castaneum]|uniref:huntingtin n=1 Tax=Tribolium castaneum TaxID=7070 RepID=UPI0030FEE789
MATQEKLLKSLEVLKTLSAPNQTFDSSKKKDKIQHCHIVTEAISNSTIKIAPSFPTYLSITIEVLLQLCDDQESDVRMTAGDCLNKVIRAMNDGNIGKVQIELHKGIKQNGSARSLRAALKRFSQLAHLIRPHKGKPYVVNLFPTLIKVSQRPEEQIHETLANSLAPIMRVLGSFTSEVEIKDLLKGFLKNISHSSPVIRRSATTCVLNVCLNCRKPSIFMAYVINYLLDLLIPVSDNQSSFLILGVLACLKNLLQHLNDNQNGDNASLSVDKLLQIYELCLHYFSNKDHNVVNAALETLNVLLQNCSLELRQILLSESGVDKSRISLPTSYSMSALRSPSQLSVATSAANDDLFLESELTDTIRSDIEKWIDESKLSVMNVPCAKTNELEKSLSSESKNSSLDVSLTQLDSFDYKISEYVGKSHSVGDNLERLTISDDSSEKSYSYIEDDKNCETHFPDVAIGSFLDTDISLVYCARLITKSFLLSGQKGVCIPDKSVRVSVKSLALTCLASIVRIYPKILLLCLGKKCKSKNHLPIADLILYENHTDPQLRGVFRTLLSNFITAVLSETHSSYDKWIESNCCDGNFARLQLDSLVKFIIKGLEDESSGCARQTIISLDVCLEKIAESVNNIHVLPILNCLPLLATNPYWLVKVALCELVSKLPYVTICNITGSSDFQNRIIDDVLFNFLRNDDARVRSGAASAIVSVIPFLYHEENAVTAKAIHYKKLFLSNLCDKNTEKDLTKKHLIDNMPSPFSQILHERCDKTEYSLSRIVTKLYHFLLTGTSNHFIYGCLETLSLLSNAYPTTVYTKAWNCKIFQTEKDNSDSDVTLDLFNICVYLLSHSVICYDLTCHLNLLNLSSNLYAGYALSLIKPISESEPSTQPWDMFSSPKFSKLSDHFLSHLVKLLNIFHYVLDDVTPSQLQSKPVLPNLSTASPIKRRKSDLEKKVLSPSKTPEKEDKDKKDSKGAFLHLPHYMKFYEILRQAYTNYKITLESEACVKFSGLLTQTLHSFAVLMEVGTLVEFHAIAEDILGYFRFTFTLEASATVECVQQLLKCLFGNNLTSNIGLIREVNQAEVGEQSNGFYHNLYQKPYDGVSECFNSFKNIHKVDCDGDSTLMGYLHRRDAKPLPVRNSDKILANYIRIFEPMVIKSLKHYTITSDVRLQCRVLQLLNQLIQLRVNYCLLDSEQIFIGFVLKQFDYIEKGQILLASDLVKKIFQFLVQLSHSKQHSKSIITVPKIIHLCDGLMASEQSPLTHCIPALEPIVENIFLTRNKSNTADAKELETTRDVVLSMLLRLYEYHEVIDLVALILDDSKYCSNSEKWLRWSTQVTDAILPMLRQNKIRLDSVEALVSLRRLIFVLEPSVFQPVDSVLLLLFQEPLVYDNWQFSYTRRLAKILIGLLVLSPVKEESLIAKINELKAEFAPGSIFENCAPTADPLNVLNSVDIFREVAPEMIFVRFLFRVLNLASRFCVEVTRDGTNDFFIEEISIFLMYCIHIFQSGSHCKIAIFAISNVNVAQLEDISNNFLKVAHEYPIVVFLWSYVLTILNYNEKKFWGQVADLSPVSPSINQKILSTGSIILFCDYMNQDVLKLDQLSWFLTNYVSQIVHLCDEDPISEFISSVHRNSATSKIFIDSLMTTNLDSKDPVFVLQILKSVENTHPYHTGTLLKLLLPKLLISKELAVSRLVANLASRKIELLLTMSMAEVHEQLAKEDLLAIIKKIAALNLVRKNEALSSLLNKLCTQYYDISPLEFDQKRSVNPDYIKKLAIDKNWYLAQIREKCNSKETAQLLTRLDYEELCNFLRNADFSKVVFKECLRLGLDRNKTVEPLITATVTCLSEEVTTVCDHIQVFSVPTLEDSERFDSRFLTQIYDLIPSVTFYIDQLPETKVSDNSEVLVKFGVICLESINYLIDRKNFNLNYIDLAIHCCESVLKEKKLFGVLNQESHISWLCSIVNSLYKLVEYLLSDKGQLPAISSSVLQTTPAGEACYQMYSLVTWLYKNSDPIVPKLLFKPIKNIIVSLSRLSVVNSFVLIPTQVLKSGWTPELVGTFQTQVPPLPIEYLQEIDVLEEFIFRTTLLGWTSRQQFEETWMSLLSVLCNNFEDKDSLVVQDVVHASSLAVKAITALLVQTLYFPTPGNTNLSQLIHVSRYPNTPKSTISNEKLRKIQDTIERKYREAGYLPKIGNIFEHTNFEKRCKHYSYGQVSVKYLSIAAKIVEIDDKCPTANIWKHREELLESHGLDINSCLQFLLDYYTQQLKNQGSTPLRFLHEIVRSTVTISDLFTDKSQFSWMLEVFLELSKLHTVEDELLHQYLIVGISKATAVLTPDLETYETIKKLLTQYLKSSFLPSRMACLHGLLYLLEGCKLSNISIGGISEEMQIILPCATEYVQCNLNSNNEILKRSQEHTILVWTLGFFIVENIEETHLESNFISNVLSTAFTVLLQQKPPNNLQIILMKALERLVIFKPTLTKGISKQIMSLALEKTKTENPNVSILGLQLLLSYMYTDCSEQLEAVGSPTNPDHLVQTIEKISAIFEHIKRGYMSQVEILCHVLPDILNDFFSPADILTKVISEFLSPQQPHPQLLSKVVFRVFERAIEEKQLPLLQDWVVFSLSNFTQSLSVGMATWCLTCFFISASSNEWLRLFFPYVQTRVGRYEYEDRKMLCIAGADFYKNLTNQNQKDTFIENFRKIKEQPDTLFTDLLSSL